MLRHAPTRPFARRTKAWASNTWLARQILAPMVVKQTAAKVRKQHYPAPFAMIDVWKRGGSDIRQRLKLEARSVAKLAGTSTAQNLIRIFFLQERLKNQGSGTDAGIKHVHVVGAGVMGGDIAAWAAFKGFEVTLQDREMKYIQPALDRARKLYEKKLKTPEKIDAAVKRLRADVDGDGVSLGGSCHRGHLRKRRSEAGALRRRSSPSSSPTKSSPATHRAFRWTNCAPG